MNKHLSRDEIICNGGFMKTRTTYKRFLVLFFLLVLVSITTSCNHNKEPKKYKTEFKMDELENILISINNDFNKETKYLTNDEIKTKQDEIYKKIVEKYIKYNSEITVRGKVLFNEDDNPLLLSSENATAFYQNPDKFNYERVLSLSVNKDKMWSFIEDGDVVAVKGIFRGNVLSDCALISPAKIKSFHNNIDYFYKDFDSLSTGTSPIIYGLVEKIIPSKKAGAELKKDNTFTEKLKNSKYVLTLTDSSKKHKLYYFCSNPNIAEIKPGQKIAIRTFVVGPQRVGEYSGFVYAYDMGFAEYYVY